MNLKYIYLLTLLFLASCGSTRNLAYFSDLEDQAAYSEEIANISEPTIQPDDILNITVSSQNPEADALFNRGALPVAATTAGAGPEGYLVDKSGYVDFPVIGRVQLAGLSKEEAKLKIRTALEEYMRDPIVHIRFLNFRVTVIGEVNRPATLAIPSERINILQALGMAGDMTAFGNRDNVLIIREESGKRNMVRLDLNSKNVLNSPYFYLQQNDVVYVEPNKMKEVQASTNTRFLSIIVAATSLATILVARLL